MRWLALVGLWLLAITGTAAPVSFAWDAQLDYPPGVTYELFANECSLSGITATTATCDLSGNPGDPLLALVRAIPPAGYQCGDPPVECGPSAWAELEDVIPEEDGTVVPLPYLDLHAWREEAVMADPAFAEVGTLHYSGGTSVSSLASTISNVAAGDIVFVFLQRDNCADITGVSATGFGTFQLLSTSDANYAGFQGRIYVGVATASAASRVVTASFSDPASWGAMYTARYSPGSGLASLTPLDVGYNPAGASGLVAASAVRGSANNDVVVPSGKRALLIAGGADWNYYRNHTGANGFTKRVDSDTFGADTTTQWFYDAVKDAGTYGGTASGQKFGDVSGTDQYMGALIALEVNASGSTASGNGRSQGSAIAAGTGASTNAKAPSLVGYAVSNAAGAATNAQAAASLARALAAGGGASTHSAVGQSVSYGQSIGNGGSLFSGYGVAIGNSFGAGSGVSTAAGVGSSLGRADARASGASTAAVFGSTWGYGLATGDYSSSNLQVGAGASVSYGQARAAGASTHAQQGSGIGAATTAASGASTSAQAGASRGYGVASGSMASIFARSGSGYGYGIGAGSFATTNAQTGIGVSHGGGQARATGASTAAQSGAALAGTTSTGAGAATSAQSGYSWGYGVAAGRFGGFSAYREFDIVKTDDRVMSIAYVEPLLDVIYINSTQDVVH